MITNLRQFLFRKKTLAVVGMLIVLMVGVGVWLRREAEHKRDIITLTEQLLNEKWTHHDKHLTILYNSTINDAIIVHDSHSSLKLHADVSTSITYTFYYKSGVVKTRNLLQEHNDLNIELEKKGGSWLIVGDVVLQEYETFWDRIKKYAKSLLP